MVNLHIPKQKKAIDVLHNLVISITHCNAVRNMVTGTTTNKVTCVYTLILR